VVAPIGASCLRVAFARDTTWSLISTIAQKGRAEQAEGFFKGDASLLSARSTKHRRETARGDFWCGEHPHRGWPKSLAGRAEQAEGFFKGDASLLSARSTKHRRETARGDFWCGEHPHRG
jgi:hypothetical protein